MATAGDERTPVPVLEREIKNMQLLLNRMEFFIATLANPTSRNSAILPVFTMCSWWKFTMGVTPPFDGHMTLLTTLPTSSVYIYCTAARDILQWPNEETSAFFRTTCIMIAKWAKQMHWSDAHHLRKWQTDCDWRYTPTSYLCVNYHCWVICDMTAGGVDI